MFAGYYTIGNLQAKYRSQLKLIHLAILIRYPDMICLQADDPSCKELYVWPFTPPLVHAF